MIGVECIKCGEYIAIISNKDGSIAGITVQCDCGCI